MPGMRSPPHLVCPVSRWNGPRYARRYYGGEAADPRVVSVFTGIAWDEGYLDDWPGDS